MSKRLPDLIRRQRAIETTMRKFGGKQAADGSIGGRRFKLGKTDCIIMVRTHLVAMGHRRLPKIPKYSTAAGASVALRAALKQAGADEDGTIEHLLDALLPRIAPAAAKPGDIVMTEAEPHVPSWQLGAAQILLGRKFLGWHADSPFLTIQEPIVDRPFIGAWRA